MGRFGLLFLQIVFLLLSLSSGILIMIGILGILVHLIVSQRSLKLSSFFFILSFYSSDCIISIDLSLNSLDSFFCQFKFAIDPHLVNYFHYCISQFQNFYFFVSLLIVPIIWWNIILIISFNSLDFVSVSSLNIFTIADT